MTLRQKATRNIKIRQEYDAGKEMGELALKYNLSERQIQTILKKKEGETK